MTNDKGITKGEKGRDDFYEAFWNDNTASVVREEPSEKRIYDLEERTARFGEDVVGFAKTIPQGPVTNRIIAQLVGAGTSVGANYVEADDAVSKKEFFEKHRNLSKRSARDQTFFAYDCAHHAGAEAAGAQALDGSERVALNLFQNLEEWEK